MRCIVTAGPTHEPLDKVRRLTNFSTGQLGTELANYLTAQGHNVTLLLGEQASYHGTNKAERFEIFSTTADLRQRLANLSKESVDGVFHAAAVSDFSFGKIWLRSPQGVLTEMKAGKLSTREGTMLAELVPTPKIIAELRILYPSALIVGWKFEVDGGRADVVRLAERQLADCGTDACVANGPAYGDGFGLVQPKQDCRELPNMAVLFEELEGLLRNHAKK